MHPTPGPSPGPLPVHLPVNPDAGGRAEGWMGVGELEGYLEQHPVNLPIAFSESRFRAHMHVWWRQRAHAVAPPARWRQGGPLCDCDLGLFAASAPPNATEPLLAHARKLTQTTGTPAVLRVCDASCMRCDRAALHSLAHASVFRGAPCVLAALRYSGC